MAHQHDPSVHVCIELILARINPSQLQGGTYVQTGMSWGKGYNKSVSLGMQVV